MQATGTCPPRKPISKILWSWVGAFLGIYLIALLEKYSPLTGINSILAINQGQKRIDRKVCDIRS